MSFQNPALLWAFALAAVPLLIHLFNRWRHRTVRWAAMEMLLRAAQKSRGARRLRHWIILALRVLAVAAIAAVVVRPLLGGGWLGRFGGRQLDAVIVLLDRSPSMERRDAVTGKPLRERALEQLTTTLAEHRASTRIILIDSATLTPIELANAEQLAQVPQSGPSEAAASIPALLARAARKIADDSLGATEIWVASDLQQSDWNPADAGWNAAVAQLSALEQRPALRIMALDAGKIDDNTLSLLESLREGDEFNLEYRVESFGADHPGQLVVSASGNRYEEALPPFEGSLRAPLSVPLDAGNSSGWVELSLPADAAPANSRVFAVYGGTQTLHSAWLGEDSPAARASKLALAPPGAEGLAVEATADPASLDWDQLSLVVWQGPPPQSPELVARLESYLDAGGQLLLLPPTAGRPAEAPAAGEQPFLGIAWAAPEDAPSDQLFAVNPPLSDSTPLQAFRDGTPFSLERTQVIRRQAPAAEGAEVLVRFADNLPLLLRQRAGRQGAVYALATAPDYTWSSLSDQIEYFALLQRLLRAGATRLSGQLIAPVGTPLPAVAAPAVWELRDIDGRWHRLEGEPVRAGIYRAGSRLAALNVPESELRPERVEQEQITPLLGGLDVDFFLQAAGNNGKLTREVWFIAAALLMLFLLVEALLSLPPKPKPLPAPNFAGLG